MNRAGEQPDHPTVATGDIHSIRAQGASPGRLDDSRPESIALPCGAGEREMGVDGDRPIPGSVGPEGEGTVGQREHHPAVPHPEEVEMAGPDFELDHDLFIGHRGQGDPEELRVGIGAYQVLDT